MPETWVIVLGAIIVSVIIFLIAYNLISSSIIQNQRQQFVKDFSDITTQISILCDQLVNESVTSKLRIPNSVRMVFASDNVTESFGSKEARDLIKSGAISSGYHLCYQFSAEKESRCYPDLPDRFRCKLYFQYDGSLADYEDIFQNVRKILNMPKLKEEILNIKKVGDNAINVTYEIPNVFIATTTSTTYVRP